MGHVMAIKVLNITHETTSQPDESFFDTLTQEYQDSLMMCKYVAKHGDTELQFKVGFAYENNYTKPKYEEACKWYTMASKNSHREATYRLGLLYENDLGVYQDYHKAANLFNQASQLGSHHALYKLGTLYHHGKGVVRDPVKTIEYYTLSAESGIPQYQIELGKLYEEGKPVAKNPVETLKWYTKAYLQGNDDIRSSLYAMDDDQPYEDFFFEKLFQNLSGPSDNTLCFEDGYKYSEYINVNNRLGVMCFDGKGTSRNLSRSLHYFMKEYVDKKETSILEFRIFEYNSISFIQKIEIMEAFAYDEECMNKFSKEDLYKLGMIFYDGKVQSQYFNYDNIKKVFTDIDDQGSRYSYGNIPKAKNYLTAFTYLKKAADQNHHRAFIQLGIMYYCGNGVQKNSYQGNKYFDLVSYSDLGLVGDMAVIWHAYDGMKDFSKALKYYKRLRELLGEYVNISNKDRRKYNEQLLNGLGLLYEFGDGVIQDYGKALDYYTKLKNDKNKTGYLRLGLMYYYGKGVSIDYRKALYYFGQGSKGAIFGDKITYVCDEYNLYATGNGPLKKELVYDIKNRMEIEGEFDYYKGLISKYGLSVNRSKSKAQYYLRDALKKGCKRADKELNSTEDFWSDFTYSVYND